MTTRAFGLALAAILASGCGASAETIVIWGKRCEVVASFPHPKGKALHCRWPDGHFSFVIQKG